MHGTSYCCLESSAPLDVPLLMPLSFFGMVDERFADEAVDTAALKLLGRGAEFAVCGAVLTTWSASMDLLLSGPRLWTWDLRKY